MSGAELLTTGVGVNLSIEHEDVDIFARSDDVVETAVADVVGGTVAANNPLTALHKVVVESLEFLADGAALGSALSDALAELRSNLLGLVGYKNAP